MMSVSTLPISLAPDCCATLRICSMVSTSILRFPDARDLGQEIAAPRVDEQAPIGDITDIAIPAALGPAKGRAGAFRDRQSAAGCAIRRSKVVRQDRSGSRGVAAARWLPCKAASTSLA